MGLSHVPCHSRKERLNREIMRLQNICNVEETWRAFAINKMLLLFSNSLTLLLNNREGQMERNRRRKRKKKSERIKKGHYITKTSQPSKLLSLLLRKVNQ